jgi:hypothetical protein
MGQAEPTKTSSPCAQIRRSVNHNHTQILASYQVYLRTPPDSRQAIQEQILRHLASHLDTEKELLFQEIRRLRPQGLPLVEEAEVENEKIKVAVSSSKCNG